MNKLIPDYVFDSVYDITPHFLQENGVRGVLFDLDGTLAFRRTALPPDNLAAFVRTLEAAGVRVLVFSNNREKRVDTFCRALGVPYIHRAGKPFRNGFRRAAERLGLPFAQLAVIGDQIFTDVLGGNRVGALTCYVETLDRQSLWVRARYRIERGFIASGQKRMEERKKR